jgi:transcription initiation factor TFIIB
VQAEALEILSKAGKVGVTAGVYPMALAASALYVASMMDGRKLTQKAVAEAAGVKEATVRKEYKRLETVLNLEVSPQQEGELDH